MASKYWRAISSGATLVNSCLFSRRPTVAYVGGWLGKKNLGDEALFSAYKSLFPDFNLAHFNGGRLSRTLSRYLPEQKAGLLGGGTLVGPAPGSLRISRAFVRLGGELFIFGTGVEDPRFWPGEAALADWKELLDQSKFIGVRGPNSAEELSNLGVRNVRVVGDPVLTFAATEINRSPIPDSIGLNLGTADGRVWGSEQRISQEMIKLARMAREKRWRVEWLVVWPKDLAVTQQAAAVSGTANHIHRIYRDHRQFMARVRNLTAFVGMKLHATALATCALTPSVMLEYRPKCRDFMRSIGQDAFTLRTDNFRASQVWELVESWNGNRAEAATALAAAVRPIQAAQRAAASEVARLISAR